MQGQVEGAGDKIASGGYWVVIGVQEQCRRGKRWSGDRNQVAVRPE